MNKIILAVTLLFSSFSFAGDNEIQTHNIRKFNSNQFSPTAARARVEKDFDKELAALFTECLNASGTPSLINKKVSVKKIGHYGKGGTKTRYLASATGTVVCEMK